MYYFISYMTTVNGLILGNSAISVHPMDWQVQMNKEYPGRFTLINWQKIGVLEYTKHKDVL